MIASISRYSFSRAIYGTVSISIAIAFCLLLAAPREAAAETLPEIQQLLRQGQQTQALDKVNAYLGSRPKDAQGRFLKGLILTELKRHSEAIAVFTQLTEDYPELPEPYNNLAVLYAQQKQYDRARLALEMAIRTHPSYAVAYENLGDVYAKLASQAYDKALQLDTSNAAAQSKLALIRDMVSAPAASRPGQTQTAAQTATHPTIHPTTQPAAQPASTQTSLPQTPTATIIASTPSSAASSTSSTNNSATDKPVDAASVKAVRDDGGKEKAEVAKTISAWAAAWSKQDVKTYLGFYAPAFKPPKNASRKDWESEREARITRPAWIKISLNAPEIQVDGKQATAHFRQNYQASNLKSNAEKTLTLVRSGNAWLILSEESR